MYTQNIIAEDFTSIRDPLPVVRMSGSMRYASRPDKRSTKYDEPSNPEGESGYDFQKPWQLRTLRLWREAVEAVIERHGEGTEAYHDQCDALWEALPHEEDWRDETYHASFAPFAQKVIGGGQ